MSESRREAVTTMIELVGAVLVAAGFLLWWLPAGLVVVGLELIGLGYLAAPDAPRRRR